MKKILSMVLVTVLALSAALAFSGCGKKSVDKTQESYELQKGDEFVVGFDAEYPPYGYMDDNGEYTGFDLELAQAVADMNGWTLKKTPIDWDAKDAELSSAAIDCIWNGFTINGREDDYTWSVAYVNNSQVVIVPAGSDIQGLSDLAGKIVGVQAASAALDVAEAYADENSCEYASLNQFADYNTAFTELMSGALEALIIDIGVANYQIEERGGDNFIILDEYMNSEEYGIGFRKGNTGLKNQVEASLLKLVEDGTYAKLAEKYELTDFICLD